MTVVKGQLVDARDVLVGDRVILPMLGPRLVLDVHEFELDTGPEPGPRIRIVYALGSTRAFENRASAAKGPSSTFQAEAGLRPLLPDERVAIERRNGSS